MRMIIVIISFVALCNATYGERKPWREGKTFLNSTNYNDYLKSYYQKKYPSCKDQPEFLNETLGGCCSWDGKTCGQTTDYCKASAANCKNCNGQWINGGGGGGITCGDRCAHPTDGKCNGCSDCSWCWPSGSSPSDPAAACQCPGSGPGPSPSGQASTTRYWDCNQPFCEPGNLPYPHQYRPFKMSDGRIFAHAAASDVILQGHAACEKCYQLQYNGVTFVVKVDNWCPCDANPPGCCEPHFDIAVPGTDYAPASASNVCQQKDPSMRYDKGRQACSHWPWEDSADCCNSVSTDQQLNEGCRLFVGIGWNNPRVAYAEVSCPY